MIRNGVTLRKLVPSFAEKPISKQDIYVPGNIDMTRFGLTTIEESNNAARPETVYAKEWVRPKPVSRVSGNKLITYKRDEFRRVNKEAVLNKLNIIPDTSHASPELQSFGRRRIGLGTLGQTSSPTVDTGPWGILWGRSSQELPHIL